MNFGGLLDMVNIGTLQLARPGLHQTHPFIVRAKPGDIGFGRNFECLSTLGQRHIDKAVLLEIRVERHTEQTALKTVSGLKLHIGVVPQVHKQRRRGVCLGQVQAPDGTPLLQYIKYLLKTRVADRPDRRGEGTFRHQRLERHRRILSETGSQTGLILRPLAQARRSRGRSGVVIALSATTGGQQQCQRDTHPSVKATVKRYHECTPDGYYWLIHRLIDHQRTTSDSLFTDSRGFYDY